MKNYYEILEVRTGATTEEIHKSYQRLQHKWHPDKNPGKNHAQAEEMAKLLNAAWDVLRDEERRREYDLGEAAEASSAEPTPKSEDQQGNGPIVDYYVPMEVDEPTLKRAFDKHLVSGAYTPDDLLTEARLVKFRRFYVTAYFYTVDYDVKWSAQFGFDRQEEYIDFKNVRENDRTVQRLVKRQRTVTDWERRHDTDSGSYSQIACAGVNLSEAVMELVESQREGRPYDASATAGSDIDFRWKSSDSVFARRIEANLENHRDNEVKHNNSEGDRQKDWNIRFTRKDETFETVLLPVCHVSYQYQDKSYEAWFDGTSATQIADGSLPADSTKLNRDLFGLWPVAAWLAMIFVSGFAGSGSFWSAFDLYVFGLLGFDIGYALWRMNRFQRYSDEVKLALLNARASAAEGQPDCRIEPLDDGPGRPWMLGNPALDKQLVVSLAIITALFVWFEPSRGKVSSVKIAHIASPAAVAGPSAAALRTAPLSDPRQQPAAEPTLDKHSSLSAATAFESDSEEVMRIEAGNPALSALITAAAASDWSAVERQQLNILADAPLLNSGLHPNEAADAAGSAAIKVGDLARAGSMFSQELRSDPEDLKAHEGLAKVYIQQGHPSMAAGEFFKALKYSSTRSSAWIGLSQVYAAAGTEAKTTACLEMGIYFARNRLEALATINELPTSLSGASNSLAAADVMRNSDRIPHYFPVSDESQKDDGLRSTDAKDIPVGQDDDTEETSDASIPQPR